MPRPDEGLIHAWLDGQLPSDEAARVEQLAATDPEWSAAVAEARGLVAASSRILLALDHVPAGVVPQGTLRRATRRLPWWSKAAAAVVVMAGGSMLVVQRTAVQRVVSVPAETAVKKAADAVLVPRAVPPSVASKVATAPTRAAVSRNEPSVTEEAPVPRREVLQSTASAAPSVRAEAPPARQATGEPAQQRGLEAPRAVIDERAIAQRAVQDVQRRDAVERSAQRVATNAEAAKAFAVGATRDAVSAAAPVMAGVSVTAASSAPSSPPPEPRVVGGMSRVVSAANAHACFRLQDGRTMTELPRLMRSVRTDGDTLRLEVAQGTSPLRAWLVWSAGVARGMLVTEPDARREVPVTGTVAICPQP